MIELFTNIGTWFIENLELIRTVGSLVLSVLCIVTLIIMIAYKQVVTKIGVTVKDLQKIVDDYKDIGEELKVLDTIVKQYDGTTKESIDKMGDVEFIDGQVLEKLNHVIDILGLAYSTIKNDDIRLGITSIVNNAKYIDPLNTLKEIRAKGEEVKKELEAIKQTPVVEQAVAKLEPVKEELKENVKETLRRW